jgi:hypothetical protein
MLDRLVIVQSILHRTLCESKIMFIYIEEGRLNVLMNSCQHTNLMSALLVNLLLD